MENIVRTVESVIHGMNADKSQIRVKSNYIDKYGTKVIELDGGLNGIGEWNDYLYDLYSIFSELSLKKIHAWMISLENDCLDDIFTVKIGVREEE